MECGDIIHWNTSSDMPMCTDECKESLVELGMDPIGKHLKCCTCDNDRRCFAERRNVGLFCEVDFNNAKECQNNEKMCNNTRGDSNGPGMRPEDRPPQNRQPGDFNRPDTRQNPNQESREACEMDSNQRGRDRDQRERDRDQRERDRDQRERDRNQRRGNQDRKERDQDQRERDQDQRERDLDQREREQDRREREQDQRERRGQENENRECSDDRMPGDRSFDIMTMMDMTNRFNMMDRFNMMNQMPENRTFGMMERRNGKLLSYCIYHK